MTKIVVTIESNDSDVSNAVTVLLRNNPFFRNYELEIKACYMFAYRAPLDDLYFVDAPIYAMRFYYHFDEYVINRGAGLEELEAFAKAYAPHIKTIMANSGQFTERLENTENSLTMALNRLGADSNMYAMRRELASSAGNIQFFSSSSPQNRVNSKVPYYLCGMGLILALSAIAAPTGIAIALGCLGALLFVAGGIVLAKNKLTNVENDSAFNLSPAF